MRPFSVFAASVFVLSAFAHQLTAGAQSAVLQGQGRHGQAPIPGATVALYTYGTTGYHSAGQLLAQTGTDASGFFALDPANVKCPSASTPVYLMLVGNGVGSLEGPQFIEMAGGLTCGSLAGTSVIVNEVTTAASVYALRNFFGYGDAPGQISPYHFGYESDPGGGRAQVVANRTIATLVNLSTGIANTSSATVTRESAKLTTVANIAAACADPTGPSAAGCSLNFGGVLPPISTALSMVMDPTADTAARFGLQPSPAASAFPGGLTAAPQDWTLGISYRSPAFGLGLAPGHVSTLDIDVSGRVWFPSNAPGAIGVGYFDPGAASFGTLFTGTGMQHPDQVAIDAHGTVWASDSGSSQISGFPSASPQTPFTVSFGADIVSTAISVAHGYALTVGIVDQRTQEPSLAQVYNDSSYDPIPNTGVANSAGYIAASIAGDNGGGLGISGANPTQPTTFDFYYGRWNPGQPDYPGLLLQLDLVDVGTNGGQVIWSGEDYMAARSGSTPDGDGVCYFRARTCYSMKNQAARHVLGMAVDGEGGLWLADSNTGSVEGLLYQYGFQDGFDEELKNPLPPSYQLANEVYPHGAGFGGTLVAPTGVAVDRAGNVWVSNFGCTGASCTPGNFVLSEIVGAGGPTMTPISAQLTGSTPVARAPALTRRKVPATR